MVRFRGVLILLLLLLPGSAAAQPPAAPELIERFNRREVWDPVWRWKTPATERRPLWYDYTETYWVAGGPTYDEVRGETPDPWGLGYNEVIPRLMPVGTEICLRLQAQNIFGSSPLIGDCVLIGPPPPPATPKLTTLYKGGDVSTATPSWSWTDWLSVEPRPFPYRHGIRLENQTEVRLTGPGGTIESSKVAGRFFDFKPAAPLPNGPYQIEVRSIVHLNGVNGPVYSEWARDTVLINHPLEPPQLVSPFAGKDASATPTWTWRPSPIGVQPGHYVVRMSWKTGPASEKTVYDTFWQPEEPLPAGLNRIWLRAEHGAGPSLKKSSEVEDQVNVLPPPPQKVTLEFIDLASGISERKGTVPVSFRLVTGDEKATRAAVHVQCRFEGATATAGKDFNDAAVSIEIPSGADNGTTKTCPVSLLDDLEKEDPERLTIILSSSDAELGCKARHEMILVDDEPAPVALAYVLDPSGGLTIKEGDTAPAKLKVSLTGPPPANPTSVPVRDSSGRLKLEPATLSFDPSNLSREVQVSAAKDGKITGDLDLEISIGKDAAGNQAVPGLTPVEASVRVLEGDVQRLLLDPEPTGEVTLKEGGSAAYTLRLAGPPPAPVTVSFQVSDPRIGEAKWTGGTTLSADNWSQGIGLVVSALDNEMDGDDVPFAVTLRTEPALPSPTLLFRRTDDDPPFLILDPVEDLTLREGSDCPERFTVSLSSAPSGPVTLPVTSGSNRLTVEPATLTFDASNWWKTLPVFVSAVDDRRDSGGDTDISIWVGGADDTLRKEVTVILEEDDEAAITFEPWEVRADEPGATAEITVRLSTVPDSEVKVPLFTQPAGRLTFSENPVVLGPGALEKKVQIHAVNDPDIDGVETFRVWLQFQETDDQAYLLARRDRDYFDVTSASDDVQAFVFDPDPLDGISLLEGAEPTRIRFRLASRPAAPVPVAFTIKTAEKTVLSGEKTFRPERWEEGDWAEIFLAGSQNDRDEPDLPMELQVAVKAGTNLPAGQVPPPRTLALQSIDEDAAGVRFTPPLGLLLPPDGTPGKVRVALTSRPAKPVTVPLYFFGLDRTLTPLGERTFDESNWQTGHEVEVPAGPGGQIAPDPLQSEDPRYGLWPAGVTVASAGAEPGVAVFPAAGLITSEAGGSAVFSVALRTRPTQTVTVPLSVPSGDARVSPASLTFTPDDWARVREVTVTGQDDGVTDRPAPYTVVTGPAASNDPVYAGFDPPDVQAMSVAGETPAIVAFPLSTETTENGVTFAQLSVVLSRPPSRDVVLDLKTSAAEGTARAERLVFTPQTWNLPQTVSVKGRDDLLDNGDRTWRLRLDPAASVDLAYATLHPLELELTNRDNDTAGLIDYPEALTVTENGETTLSLGLRSQPTAPVVLRLTSSDPEQIQVVPDILLFPDHPHAASVAQRVAITAGDEPASLSGVTATIQVQVESADPLYDGITAPGVNVVKRDDDEVGIEVQPIEGVVAFESAGPGKVRVRLRSRPAADVTIPVSISRPAETILSTSSLTFTPDDWSGFQEVSVSRRYHPAGDPPTVHTIGLGPAVSHDPEYSGLDAPDVRVLSLEDFSFDVSPLSGLTTTEGGGVARFNVAVPFQPQADLHIPLGVSDPSEATVTPQELVFTPRDWDVPRTVQVAGVDDDEVDGPQSFSVTVGPIRTAEPGMDGWELPPVELVNLDDDVELADESGSFYTVTPCRVLDTRNVGGPLAPAQVRIFPVQGHCGIPQNARAVAVSVTAVNPAADGWMGLFPGDVPPTGTSVVAFRAGVSRASSAVLSLSSDGTGTLAAQAELRAGATVHLAVDVLGWFE